ncbi:DUF2333 family protein [Pleionea litopenaei]|uniref:DUF2333 family protein n=1 Tax=Pleionea litopenaei TaxID=3070815 RepID=A0AA51X919_9GAMM|nr:DUF2333 family protein [Pleionea sp. HL-JVS1]WMS88705.1 DUF2333 family protein [Pleionea sp. HL-JVS1]
MSEDALKKNRFLNPIQLIVYALILTLIGFYFLAVYWSIEPETFDVRTDKAFKSSNNELIVGYTTVDTTIKIGDTLLNKQGGFLSNDILPPSLFMDNMPAWEYGVLVQIRDMAATLRNHMSRSQSQSIENVNLKEAEPLFNIDRLSWILPEAEDSYQLGMKQLEAYRDSLADQQNMDAQFYARADNLRIWLEVVEKRLGSLSQRLTASVGQERVNTDLAGDAAATQSTDAQRQLTVKTPWLQIDDNFYEARGTCWALIHLLKAIEVDFAGVLEKKNATVSLRQIIRELESTQDGIWSPMILNGDGFGLMANHSLVMASYVSRANAAIIDLRELLEQG